MSFSLDGAAFAAAPAAEADMRTRTETPGLHPVASSMRQMTLSQNGVALDAATRQSVTGISVSLGANQQGSFKLEIDDPALRLIDPARGVFCEGQALEIALGNAATPLTTVIAGTVSAIAVELDAEDGLNVQVEGQDALSAVAAGSVYMRHRQEWNDYEVLNSIAVDTLKLTLSIDSVTQSAMSEPRTRARAQSGVSHLEFIAALANEYGCEFWADRQTLHFRRELPGKQINLQQGVNIFSISFRLSTSGQVSAVEGRGWSTEQAKELTARVDAAASSGFWRRLSRPAQSRLSASGQVRSMIAHDLAEARRQTSAEMRRLMGMLITAEGTTTGNPEMRVGGIVNVIGMGRFDGEYQVQALVHRIGKEGFRTDFTLRLHV